MPAFTCRPSGAGTYADFAGSVYTNVNDSNTGTYMNTGQNVDWRSSFAMDNLPADAGSISGSVTLSALLAFTGDPISNLVFFRYSGANLDASIANNGDYSTTSADFALAPGSVAWTVAIFNASEIGCRMVTGANDFGYCAELYATGTYIQSGEIFVSIYNLVAPLIGSSLLLPQLVSAARSCAPRITFSPEELRTAWRQYKDKSYKFPSYHFMGA